MCVSYYKFSRVERHILFSKWYAGAILLSLEVATNQDQMVEEMAKVHTVEEVVHVECVVV